MFAAVLNVCTLMKSTSADNGVLLIAMHPVLLGLEIPTMAIWLVFQLQHLPFTAMFWFEHDGQLITAVTHLHVWVLWSRTRFMQPGIVASTLHPYHARLYRNHVQDHPFKRSQAWTGLDWTLQSAVPNSGLGRRV